MSEKTKKRIGIVIIVFVVLFLGLICWKIALPLVQTASHPEEFREWITSKGVWSELIYIGIVVVQVVIAIIPGEPFEIAGGYTFGALEGSVLCILATALGSIIVFLLVRRFGQDLVELFFSREKIEKLHFLKNNRKREFLLFVIYMLPGTPKDLISWFAGLTDLPLKKWIFISIVGRIPSVITSTIGGNYLGEKEYLFAVITFGVTILITGICYYIYTRICKKQENKNTGENS